MIDSDLILAIDQGTTSTRAVIFDVAGNTVASAQKEFQQYFPDNGQVEHDAEEIWNTTEQVCQDVLTQIGERGMPITTGISNQRETVVIWDRSTGVPIHKAIVWQDRRTAELCNRLKLEGLENMVSDKTGLLLDPYFSATKLAWILDHVDGARQKAENGQLVCGTIDTFLIWRLTGAKVHATDASNASRTMLFNIHSQQWDDDLLQLFNIPKSILPEVKKFR